MGGEKFADPALILGRGEVVYVLVPCPQHLPDLLRTGRFREERSRLVELGVLIFSARDQQERLVDPSDHVDGTQPAWFDANPRCDQLNERRGDGAAEEAERSEPDVQTVGNGVVESWIHRLEHECVHREGLRPDECRRATHRHADDPDPFAWRRAAKESERGFRVEAFQRAEGDVLARTLTMRLEVGREDREARLVQKVGTR